MEDSVDESQATIKSVALKYGLISGLIGIIFFIILDVSGQAGNQSLSWIGIVIGAAIIYLAQKEFLKNGDGYMKYSEGLGLGTLLSLVSAIISSVFSYFYISFINPTYLDIIRQQQIMDLEERGMSDAEIEQAMKIAENFSGPTAILIFGIVFGVLFGFLISLVISAINKKARPEFE